MEQERTNAGQTLGIIGLILGIITFMLGFIPCIGIIAIIPGIIAIILSAIGLSQANRDNGARSINITALIVSIVGVLVASLWLIFVVGIANLSEDEIEGFVEDVIEKTIDESVYNPDLQDALQELEEQLDEVCVDSISFKTDSINIEINIDDE
jgi:membrane-bound ClpP family serine protease